MNTIIAIPSARPGGLGAKILPYSCYGKFYTLVPVEEGEIDEDKVKGIGVKDVELKGKEEHLLSEHYRKDKRITPIKLKDGGCYSPSQWRCLYNNEVKTLIVHQLSNRQLLEMRGDFEVFYGALAKDGEKIKTVRQAVAAFIQGRLDQLLKLSDPRCCWVPVECRGCPESEVPSVENKKLLLTSFLDED